VDLAFGVLGALSFGVFAASAGWVFATFFGLVGLSASASASLARFLYVRFGVGVASGTGDDVFGTATAVSCEEGSERVWDEAGDEDG
jgi:hypothetical protein